MSWIGRRVVSEILTAEPAAPMRHIAQMAILRGKRLRWPDWTGSHASDAYGTALAPSGDKRRDKDRTRTTTRRAETLLHIQASKRPMSPARAGLLFSRTIHCNRDGA